MTNSQKFLPLISFIIFLILTVLGRQYIAAILESRGVTDYTTHTLFSTGINVLIAIVSFIYIKRFKLVSLAGLGKSVLMNKWLLLFPLYLVIINLDMQQNFRL